MKNSIDSLIQKLRSEMYKCIEKYGLSDQRTVQKSQELDVLIVQKQREGAA